MNKLTYNIEVDVYNTFLEKCASLYKVADILSERMPLEDWNTGTLAEKNRYLDSLPVGDYQLFSKNGVPEERFAHGMESDVFHALGSTKNPELSPILEGNSYGNVVIKKPATLNPFEQVKHNIANRGGKLLNQHNYKKDIQAVTKNKIWLPFNDFEGAGKGNIVSEFLRELYAWDKTDMESPEVKRLLDQLGSKLQVSSVGLARTRAVMDKLNRETNNWLNIPMVRGKSGKLYHIHDIYLPGATAGTNLGIDPKSRLKLMDYLAVPVELNQLKIDSLLKTDKGKRLLKNILKFR